MTVTIKTNNKSRDLLYFHELPARWQKEYQDVEEKDDLVFFIYRNWCYRLDDFMRVERNEELKDWHGYSSDTFFSGVLIKYLDQENRVVVGRYCS